jgi:hypothetical protein
MLGLSVGFSTSRGMSCSQTTPPLCNTAGWSFFSRVERSQKESRAAAARPSFRAFGGVRVTLVDNNCSDS